MYVRTNTCTIVCVVPPHSREEVEDDECKGVFVGLGQSGDGLKELCQ